MPKSLKNSEGKFYKFSESITKKQKMIAITLPIIITKIFVYLFIYSSLKTHVFSILSHFIN